MRTVELFAGIGGFRIASDNCGYETVWANDLNERSVNVYKDKFGQIVKGDIRHLLDEIPPHDLLTAGFPCQPFSSAGKKLGVRDPRGTLFGTIVQTLERHSPKYFVLENVKRLLSMEKGSHFSTIIHALSSLPYRIEWRLLNALDFGLAQNRQRVVIVGVRVGEARSNPVLKNGILATLLATASDLESAPDFNISKAGAFSEWDDVKDVRRRFPTWGLAFQNKFYGASPTRFSEAAPRKLLKDILQEPGSISEAFDFTKSTIERLGESVLVDRYVGGVQLVANQGGGARMGYTVFGIDGVAPTLTASTSRHYERYKVNDVYRRLTNIEYARLQGFADDHCSGETVYNQYELYGNAVPPPLVEWVLRRLKWNGVRAADLPALPVQQGLF